MIFFKVSLIWIWVYLIIYGFFILFITGVSFILSTIGVYINDLKNAWKVITRLLFFATPLFYIIPKEGLLYKINLFNPLFYFIGIARELIIYHKIPEYWMISVMIGFSIVFFILGFFIFNKYKNNFAEMI